uniref:Uncharacterized protein n=1 Tax=Rhizophora mucronata TaxID=61149 RepID=A0A2P2KM57_RHIMU
MECKYHGKFCVLVSEISVLSLLSNGGNKLSFDWTPAEKRLTIMPQQYCFVQFNS